MKHLMQHRGTAAGNMLNTKMDRALRPNLGWCARVNGCPLFGQKIETLSSQG
jgi:hypothetical protein